MCNAAVFLILLQSAKQQIQLSLQTDMQCSCVSNSPAICEAANTAQFKNGCAMQLCFQSTCNLRSSKYSSVYKRMCNAAVFLIHLQSAKQQIQLSLQTDVQCSCVSNPPAICEAAREVFLMGQEQ